MHVLQLGTQQTRCERHVTPQGTHGVLSQIKNLWFLTKSTAAGVAGYNKHKPIDDKKFQITVYFNHDCLKYNPSHRICFPTVGACGKEITIPVIHMSTFEELNPKSFKELFILAFCKGQAFAKP